MTRKSQGPAIFNLPDWPRFRWDEAALALDLAALAEEETLLSNKLKYVDPFFLDELLRVVVYEELVASFNLDDEFLEPALVKDALAAKSLDFADNLARLPVYSLLFGESDQVYIENFINFQLDVRVNPNRRLTPKRLKRWRLFMSYPGTPAGLDLTRPVVYGDTPARPGAIPGAQEAYPAPVGDRLAKEISRFFSWLDAPWPHDPALKAALAHLWLLIAQPYLGVSGRISRAAMDLVYGGRGEMAAHLSLSKALENDREGYLTAFSEALFRQNLDVTDWLRWHVGIFMDATAAAALRFDRVICQAAHWAKETDIHLTSRQKKVLALLGAELIGPLTPERYARLSRCDALIAEKELFELIERELIDPDRLALAAAAPKSGWEDLVF
jgi:Fic family protein